MDNSNLKAYALCQLAIYLLDKIDQLNSSGIEEEIDLLMSAIQTNKLDKGIDAYKNIYNQLDKNKETMGEFSKYKKEFEPK